MSFNTQKHVLTLYFRRHKNLCRLPRLYQLPVSYVSTYTLFSEYLLVSRHRGRYIHIAVYILTPRRFADFINSSLQKALKIYADFPDINNFLCVLCMYAPFSEYVLVSGQTGRIHIVVNILIPHSFCGVS